LQEHETAIGFKLTNIKAEAHDLTRNEQSEEAAGSSSSSSSSSSTRCVFMHLVKLTLGAKERPPNTGPGSFSEETDIPLTSCNTKGVVSDGIVDSIYTYK
jgi:hypothetical protein